MSDDDDSETGSIVLITSEDECTNEKEGPLHGRESKKRVISTVKASPVPSQVAGNASTERSEARRLKCPLCRHTGTRYFRLKTHAEAKHGLRRDGASMTRFMAKCRKINARGVRVTANSDLQRILGQFARSPSHIRVAKRVLRHCASAIDTDQQRNSPFTEPHSNKTRALHGPDAMPSTTTYARQRRADIDSAGLVAHFGKLCVSADAYLLSNSWKTCSLATATANARMVHRFLSWAKNQTEHIDDEEIQLLCDPDLPHEFVRVLSSVLKPYSVKNHVTAMYGFIDAVIWNKQLQLGIKCADGLKAQLKTIREIWLRLKGDTQRLARRKQRAVTRSGQFANAPILWIIQFLNQSGKKCDKLMKDPLMESAHLLETVRCVCATYLALHGQRLSSILNLTLKEINAANYTQGRFVLRIQNHKTSKTSGPASIALKPHQYKLIKFMAETYGGKGRGDKAFPIRESGRTSSILFKPLNAFIRSRSGHQDTAITCNKIRKTIESNKYLVGGESSEKSRAVSSYLMHGKNVTDLHYSFKTDYMVVYEGRLVESVVSSLVFLDLVRDGTVPLAAADAPFPAADSILARVEANFASRDVSFDLQGATPLHECIVSFWRDTCRNKLVDTICSKLSSLSPTSDQMRQVIRKLDPVWRCEEHTLLQLVKERLLVTDN